MRVNRPGLTEGRTAEVRKPSGLAPLDFPAVVALVDLRSIVEADRGHPDRAGRFTCPFHDDRNPSLTIAPDGRHFRCWSCGASGTALDWTMRREGVDVVEAARRLDPRLGTPRPRRNDGKTSQVRVDDINSVEPPPDDDGWQAAVDGLVRLAETTLWSKAGRPALAYLRRRGLLDHTIRRFRLGYLPHTIRRGPVTAARGIVIPWLRPGSWYSAAPDPDGADPGPRWVGANIRRLAETIGGPDPDPRYLAFKGGHRGYLYPYPDIEPTQGIVPALVVEGELDGLLGWQLAGHLAHVVTVGSATIARLPRATLAALARCPLLLIATDHDRAGVEAARRWREMFPHKARRVLLPHGKDLTDFATGGGDVAAWLRSELDRTEAASCD